MVATSRRGFLLEMERELYGGAGSAVQAEKREQGLWGRSELGKVSKATATRKGQCGSQEVSFEEWRMS